MNRKLRLLVVEDEAAISSGLRDVFVYHGYDVTCVADGAEGLDRALTGRHDLVLLDVMLPSLDGFSILERIRAVDREQPVIMLTAKSGDDETIQGLSLGADDYVAKPFSPRELTARVRAVLRRVDSAPSATAEVAQGWHHDPDRCRIVYRGRALDLTRNEYRLLAALVGSPGRVFSRDQLMELAWDDPGAALDRTVDAHVKQVRAKLREIAPDEEPIVTHRGLGYSLKES